MDARDKVLLDYGNLAEGERKSGQVCPMCNGGSARERSFSVGRLNNHLAFICFRASCSFKGRITITGGTRSQSVHDKLKPFAPVQVIRRPIPQELEDTLAVKYNIDIGMFDWARWCYTDDYKGTGPRVGIPILDPDGEIRGISWRSYAGAKPKALIEVVKQQQEQICWYRGRRHGKTLVIVEDQPSALRIASQGVDALALCGTLLNLNRIYEIKAQGYKTVFLCLDEDATRQAVAHAVAYKARLPALRIMELKDDIKDMDAEDFELFIQEVTNK